MIYGDGSKDGVCGFFWQFRLVLHFFTNEEKNKIQLQINLNTNTYANDWTNL